MELLSKGHDGQVNVLKSLQQGFGRGTTGGPFGVAHIQAWQGFVPISQAAFVRETEASSRRANPATTSGSVRSLADQLATVKGQLSSADESLRLTRQRKEFGVGNVLENIQAEQDLTRARNDYVAAIAEYDKAQYALRHAIGASAPTGAE